MPSLSALRKGQRVSDDLMGCQEEAGVEGYAAERRGRSRRGERGRRRRRGGCAMILD